MGDEGQRVPGRWNQRQRDWAVSLWVPFLAACCGSFVLFAVLDPHAIAQGWVLGWETGVRLVYGLGFAFCFLIAFMASRLTTYMIRTGPRRGHAQGKGRQRPPEVHDPAEGNPDLEGQKWQ